MLSYSEAIVFERDGNPVVSSEPLITLEDDFFMLDMDDMQTIYRNPTYIPVYGDSLDDSTYDIPVQDSSMYTNPYSYGRRYIVSPSYEELSERDHKNYSEFLIDEEYEMLWMQNKRIINEFYTLDICY